jgi:peptidoglycan/xylan/chitin deacetylase (PgdA/CDA1 family)
MKAFLLRLARISGCFALTRILNRGCLKILCYHGIWIGPAPHYGDCLYMAAPTFAERMAWLQKKSYRVLTLDEGLRKCRDGQLGSRDVVITIDDAWYGTWLHMVPVLQRHAFPSTLYVPTLEVVSQEPVFNVLVHYLVARTEGSDVLAKRLRDVFTTDTQQTLADGLLAWILSFPQPGSRRDALRKAAAAVGVDVDDFLERRVFGRMTPAELAEASVMGVDMQLHTHTHSMHGMDEAAVREEIAANRQCLAEILGRPAETFTHFCYPSGEHDASVQNVLRTCGIESATTTEPGLVGRQDDRLTMNRILDCQSLSLDELEARLTGFWALLARLRSIASRGSSTNQAQAVSSGA